VYDNMDKKFITSQAKSLHEALAKRGIASTLEYSDGHKCVDIGIPEAKLYIEVNGLQHFTDPKQIIADFKRAHYSNRDNFVTFYVTNQLIEKFLDDIADAVAEVVKERIKDIQK